MESIEEKLKSQLADKFGTNPELSDGLAFIGVDSVGMAELTVDIEQHYGIHIDDDIVNVETVQDLADYIRQKQQTSSPTE